MGKQSFFCHTIRPLWTIRQKPDVSKVTSPVELKGISIFKDSCPPLWAQQAATGPLTVSSVPDAEDRFWARGTNQEVFSNPGAEGSGWIPNRYL